LFPPAGLILEQVQVAALVVVDPDGPGHGGVVEEIARNRAGCRNSSRCRITAMPPDVAGNQPSLPIGYQFCSRPECVVTPPRVAAGIAM
jgi:hypothetical protein